MRRLLVIVLHGAGPYYLDPLLESNRLPNIARLLAGGTHAALRAPYPLSASAWVTILTGESIGVHGVVDSVQRDARRYHLFTGTRSDSSTYRDRTIFSILSGAGKRAASVFLPMTYPPWEINGVIVSGFPVPDERRPSTWPPELSGELDPMAPHPLMSLRYAHRDRIRDYLAFNTARIEEVTANLWRSGEYDLLATCFPAPDQAHHYFWSEDTPAALEPIYQVYERLDATIGRLMEMVDHETCTVLFSDHGGGPAPTRVFAINRWLEQQGYLATRPLGARRLGLVRTANQIVQWAKRTRLNHRVAPYVRGRLREVVSSVTHNDAFVDWSRSRAYGMDFTYPLVGVEINRRGRQKRGIVPPGAPAERLADEIRERLGALRDPVGNGPVFRDVLLRDDMFHGPFVERLPDLVGILDPAYDGRTQLSDEPFSPNELQGEYPFLGYHRPEAILVAQGPGIARGLEIGGMEMIDVAPTLLGLLGVPPPPSMEGRARSLAHTDEP